MLYCTGDTHGLLDHFFYTYGRCKDQLLPQYATLTEDDIVIVAGDFQYVWDDSPKRTAFLDRLASLPFQICFVDGNHENFDLLYSFPVEEWCGGKVHRIQENIRHLMRGEIFHIQGRSIFAFGGAGSFDREMRIEGLSWWPQEIPTQEEQDHGMENLMAHGSTVDYIICHTCPDFLLPIMRISNIYDTGDKTLMHFLAEVVTATPAKNFHQFLFGHWHRDAEYFGGRYRALYDDLIELPLTEQEAKPNE